MDSCRQAAVALIMLVAVSHLSLDHLRLVRLGVPVQSPVGSVCITPYLQCPLTVPSSVGTPCFCMTPNGNIPGMAK